MTDKAPVTTVTMTLQKTNQNVWRQMQNAYFPGTTALQSDILPAGIYHYGVSMAGWFLERVGSEFEFPYKLYGHHDHILQRISKAWEQIEGNLGILLNGIKGTGKTVTAQLIANMAIKAQIPVLIVREPISGLADVLSRIQQPLVVIFDEFEKTHKLPEAQTNLLTAIDGMARTQYKRLFVFTTNEKSVDPNFVDRPSRIRYCWEFMRLSDDVVESLLDDLLDPALTELRASVVTYLNTRKILSIDVVKTVINEVNLFREAPEKFAEAMNLSEQDNHGFRVEILDKNRNVVKLLSQFFDPSPAEVLLLRSAMTRSGCQAFGDRVRIHNNVQINQRYGGLSIQFRDTTEHLGEFVVDLKLPRDETWIGNMPKLYEKIYYRSLWVDPKPEGWKVPEWATAMQSGKDLTDEQQEAFDDWSSNETLYGGEQHETFLVRLTTNFETKPILVSHFNAF